MCEVTPARLGAGVRSGIVATATPHTWQCPSCGRRVPLRAEACHCGMTRARAERMAAAVEAPQAAPRPTRRVLDRRAAVAAMTTDVKLLVGAIALVIVLGLGWAVFGPAPPPPPPVLGYADSVPPKQAAMRDPKRPPFKLPWWK